MPRTQLSDLLASMITRVVTLAESDAELRLQLGSLARAVLSWTESTDSSSESPVSDAPPSRDRADTESVAPRSETVTTDSVQPSQSVTERDYSNPAEQVPLPALTLGQPRENLPPSQVIYPREYLPAEETDLKLVASRCRMKAEAARWAAERRRLMASGAEYRVQIEPTDREIIARAKTLSECFLWTNHPQGPSPTDPGQYEELARGFETMAEVLEVLTQYCSPPNDQGNVFEQLVDLLAATQSALRVTVESMDWEHDHDQMAVFKWLCRVASEKQFLIARHMKIGDPADPAHMPQFLERLHEIDNALQTSAKQLKDRKRLLGKVRHKASILREATGDQSADWHILIETVNELIEGGLPPSSRELREILQTIIDDMPQLGELPKNFDLVQREIDRYLATNSFPETVASKEVTPEVRSVAQWLKGRQMVLIGGDRRPAAYQNLKTAFALDELIWVEVNPHQPLAALETPVGRPEVAVVVLAIRWCSHSHKEVEVTCDRFGKPFVLLPGGYGVNQVAAKIVAQCGERLARSAPPV